MHVEILKIFIFFENLGIPKNEDKTILLRYTHY